VDGTAMKKRDPTYHTDDPPQRVKVFQKLKVSEGIHRTNSNGRNASIAAP
jgi:hypothetical protein